MPIKRVSTVEMCFPPGLRNVFEGGRRKILGDHEGVAGDATGKREQGICTNGHARRSLAEERSNFLAAISRENE